MNRSHTFQTIRLQRESESDSLLSGRQPMMNATLQPIQHLMSFSLPHLHLSCLSFVTCFSFFFLSLPSFHSFCYVAPTPSPPLCPPLSFRCRPGRLPQPPERRLLPGPGVSGEMPLRGHRGRLLQPQTDPRTCAHPRTHHGPVSRLTFHRGVTVLRATRQNPSRPDCANQSAASTSSFIILTLIGKSSDAHRLNFTVSQLPDSGLLYDTGGNVEAAC